MSKFLESAVKAQAEALREKDKIIRNLEWKIRKLEEEIERKKK